MNNAKFFSLEKRSETTALRQPKELCSFSRTFDGEYANDDSSLSYFFLPDSDIDGHIDLAAGFKNFKKFDEARDGEFNGLLAAIQEHEEKSGSKVKASIITWRGIMTKLLTLPYNQRDPVDLNLVYFDGHIFIQQDPKAKKLEQEKNKPSPQQEKLMFSGYKFESVATVPKPLTEASRSMIEKRHKKLVSNVEQYCSVVRTGIGKQKIIIGGEVDCVWDYKPHDANPLSHYVELKTSKQITEPGHSVTFEKKLFRTWAQCFLLGITKVIYGFRDDNLILRSVEEYKVEDIPNLLKSNPVNTNPKKLNCVDALKWYGAVVEWITQEIPEDESKAWRLSYEPSQKTLSLYRLSADVADDVLNGGIITDEFKEWRARKNQEKKVKKEKKKAEQS